MVQDSGPAGGNTIGQGLSELNVTAQGAGTAPFAGQGTGPLGTINCTQDGPASGPYHYLCFSANAQGGGLIAYGSGNGASDLPLNIIVNGVTVPFGGGGGGAVSSVFGRTGAVVATTNDYSFSQIGGIAAPGQLPVATVAAFGAVKPDGSTITISAGVISAVGSGGGSAANTQDFLSGIGFTPGVTTSLTLSAAPVNASALQVSFDGIVQAHNTWSLVSATVNFVAAIPVGVQVVEAQWLSASVVAGSLSVGSTTIGSGTSGRVLYDNAGLLGELSTTGSGNVVLATAPTIAGATVSGTANFTGTFQFGGNTITLPGLAATVVYKGSTWVSGQCVQTSGTAGELDTTGSACGAGGGGASPGGAVSNVQYNNTVFGGNSGFTYDGTSAVTLGVAGASVGSVGFRNATSGTITLQPVTGALGTVALLLPAVADTLVARTTTDTFTNKTFDTGGTGNVFRIAGTSITAVSGTGAVCLVTNCVLVTPTLGVATATSITGDGSGLTGITASQVANLSVDTVAALKALTTRPSVVELTGYTTAGDGGGGYVRWAAGSVATQDNCLVFTPTSGPAGRWLRILPGNGPYNVLWCGAVNDGVTVNTAANQAAIDAATSAGGGIVYFPPGINLTGKLTLNTLVTLEGSAFFTSTIKLANTTNDDLIYGANSNALWGTNSVAGIYNWGLRSLTLDGNMANQSAGSCLAVYGQRGRIRDVNMANCKVYGMRTEWGPNIDAGNDTFGMDPSFAHIRISYTGQHGWLNAGAHDTYAEDVVINNASQTTDNTYDAFHFTTSGRYVNLHGWNDALTAFRHRYALYLSGQGDFSHGQFEGSVTANVFLDTTAVAQFDDTNNYFNAWGAGATPGAQIIIRGPLNRIRGYMFQDLALGRPNSVGVVMGQAGGDNLAGNDVDVTSVNVDGGMIDWSFSDGGNSVRMRGFNTAGTAYISTPNATDTRDINVQGGGGKFDWAYPQNGLAIGGATLGTDALAVTGTATFSSTLVSLAEVLGINLQAVDTGFHYWKTRSVMASPSNGVIRLTNNAQTDFTSLQFGGGTASFPEIKRNAAALNFRLADDSADAAITTAGITSSGAVLSKAATSGIGYSTGAGGTITQLTNKSTGVTLNTVSGAITMNNAALNAGTIVSFVLTDSAIAATDVLVLNHISGGTVGSYSLNAQAAGGSATINVRNNTGGSLSEAIVIQFVVLKGVNS